MVRCTILMRLFGAMVQLRTVVNHLNAPCLKVLHLHWCKVVHPVNMRLFMLMQF